MIGIELGRAMMRTKQQLAEEAEAKRQRERQEQQDEAMVLQRKFQQAALDATLREAGSIPEAEAKPIELPELQIQNSLPGSQGPVAVQGSGGNTGIFNSARYAKQDGTGRVIDRENTREARGARAKAEAALAERQQVESLQGLITRARAGDKDAQSAVVARVPSLRPMFEEKPYAPRTREEAVALAKEKAAAVASTRPSRPTPRRTDARTKYEAQWKGTRMRELVKDQIDQMTGRVVKPGLAPAEAQKKVAQEWEALSQVVPSDWLEAAAEDPEYEAYLRSVVGGEGEE